MTKPPDDLRTRASAQDKNVPLYVRSVTMGAHSIPGLGTDVRA